MDQSTNRIATIEAKPSTARRYVWGYLKETSKSPDM